MTQDTTPETHPAPETAAELLEPSQTTADSAEPPSREASSAPAVESAPPEVASVRDATAERPWPVEAAITAEPQPEPAPELTTSFADVLAEFEKSHRKRPHSEEGPRQIDATVISLTADQVFLDVGYKIEGVMPRSAFDNNAAKVAPGQTYPVSITGRNEEGYYQLSRFKVTQPTDWSALEAAFAQKLAVAGTVTAVVKGGASVDVGVRAFMPASRSGTRDAAELEALVGHEITCRITKLDTADEDVVVDRRAVLEEQAKIEAEGRYSALQPGDVVSGTVRSLMPYGAFLDLGGLDGLLHVGDIAWTRISKPEDVLTVGQKLEVKILKIDPDTRKISLGLKQLQPEPWETAPARYQAGQRVAGSVTRVAEFGAFVELEPGVEGLIHVSEMSWGKKVRIASDILKPGERVEAVILSIKPEERRIALGLKQTLTDSIDEYIAEHKAGDKVSGRVVDVSPAIVELGEGIRATCRAGSGSADTSPAPSDAKADLSSISSMLQARWKGAAPSLNARPEPLQAGQIRSFKILNLDAKSKRIEVELA